MKTMAHWAWVVVLGTALSLSWWSLDTFARRYGMPGVFAGMVSTAIDGAALVLADLAMRRATAADSAAVVKLLMIATVGLSAWLNFEHALLAGYPLAIRVLFSAPSVLGGILFELQLRYLHRTRLHQLDQLAPSLPRFSLIVWVFHPFAALGRVSEIAASRLRSIPVTVMDWTDAPISVRRSSGAAIDVPDHPVILAAPVEPADALPVADEPRPRGKAGRTPVPDELYLGRLQVVIADNGGEVPSIREIARRLSIGQERARRLVGMLDAE